jgi:hypothetical protein
MTILSSIPLNSRPSPELVAHIAHYLRTPGAPLWSRDCEGLYHHVTVAVLLYAKVFA